MLKPEAKDIISFLNIEVVSVLLKPISISELEEALTEIIGPFSHEGKGCITVDVESPEILNKAIDKIRTFNVNILEISPMKQTLEDVFVKVVEEDEVAR